MLPLEANEEPTVFEDTGTAQLIDKARALSGLFVLRKPVGKETTLKPRGLGAGPDVRDRLAESLSHKATVSLLSMEVYDQDFVWCEGALAHAGSKDEGRRKADGLRAKVRTTMAQQRAFKNPASYPGHNELLALQYVNKIKHGWEEPGMQPDPQHRELLEPPKSGSQVGPESMEENRLSV